MDEPVACQRRFSAKTFGDDEQAVVAATAGTGVASVLGRVVDQFDVQRREAGQALAQRGFKVGPTMIADSLRHAGMVCLNGLTETL